MKLRMLSMVMVLVVSTAAWAGGTFTDKAVTYRRSEGGTSLKVTAPDGSSWSKKVEVRAKNQAELAVVFKADEAKTQEKPATRSFVGKVAHEGHTCGDTWKKSLKIDFLQGGSSTVALSKEIEWNTYVNLEVPAGHYDVRMFVKTNDVWDFVATAPADVQKDGWKYSFGCTKRMTKPSLVIQ